VSNLITGYRLIVTNIMRVLRRVTRKSCAHTISLDVAKMFGPTDVALYLILSVLLIGQRTTLPTHTHYIRLNITLLCMSEQV